MIDELKPMLNKKPSSSGVTIVINNGQPDECFVKKIVAMYMRKFMQKKNVEGEQSTPSPLTTEPMGPIDNGVPEGATRAPNKSINDFTNF